MNVPRYMRSTISSRNRKKATVRLEKDLAVVTLKLQMLKLDPARKQTLKSVTSFFDLPLEIRRSVYSLCALDYNRKTSCLWVDGVPSPFPPDIRTGTEYNSQADGKTWRPSFILSASRLVPLELLLTCRQIRVEATEEVSGEACASMRIDRCKFEVLEQLQKWFRSIHLWAVRRLIIHNYLKLAVEDSETVHGLLPILNGMANLLTVEFFLSYNFIPFAAGDATKGQETVWEKEHWGSNILRLKERLEPGITFHLYIEQDFFFWCGCNVRGCPLWIEDRAQHGGFPTPDRIFRGLPKWISRLPDCGFDLSAPVTLWDYKFSGARLTRLIKPITPSSGPPAVKE
jgi:hypothetical protein